MASPSTQGCIPADAGDSALGSGMSALRASASLCTSLLVLLHLALLTVPAHAASKGKNGDKKPAESPALPTLKDPIVDDYRSYTPPFIEQIRKGDRYRGPFRGWRRKPAQRKLSTEKSFFTSNFVREDDRANALVKIGIKKEMQGEYRDALRIYRRLFERVLRREPDLLYRVSKHGVFVPVSQYVQRRILNFPKEDLAFYRMVMDPEASDMFGTAKRKYSLEGFCEIVDRMLATSYGDNALFELGNAELDAGHYLAALDYFRTVRDFFADSDCRTPELFARIKYCRKMLGLPPDGTLDKAETKAPIDPESLKHFERVVRETDYRPPPFHAQRTSPPHASTDDYALHPPPVDPLAIRKPQWDIELPGAFRDNWVYTQPVVTDHSVIYRHKNILYCRSILTGELRWKNDLGGRAVWQNRNERMYPWERVLVQDGMVFSPVHKFGPSLVAFDEVTGAVRWAHGPVVASTEEEARMRFESAPAWGPQTVFATYTLDNIEGPTHTDSEYGAMAFDARTGRVKWRAKLGRLPPGAFASGTKGHRRNRIRSFSSPPLYHQGRVYVCTNAGVIASLDALSGRVQWLMRYPYNPTVHDATREYGRTYSGVYTDRSWWPHDPMFWFSQRPLVVGDRMYITPVDSKLLLCLERYSGKVLWSRHKSSVGFSYLMGPISTGELVLARNGRSVELLDPKTGETTWDTNDLVEWVTAPLLTHMLPHSFPSLPHRKHGTYLNKRYYGIGAHPFLVEGDRLCVTSWTDIGIYYQVAGSWWPDLTLYNLAWVDLKNRKVTNRRRFFSGRFQVFCQYHQQDHCPKKLRELEQIPSKSNDDSNMIRILRSMIEDEKPVNKHGPFRPFSRLTMTRYGVPFELRFGTRSVSMWYDLEALQKRIKDETGPEADFARAELTLGDGRLEEASILFKRCLKNISSEDLDFRARVNRQLYLVHKRLTRSGIRTGNRDLELEQALGMASTAGRMADEVETLFALAEAYEHRGEFQAAERLLQSIISRYGRGEYPVASLSTNVPERVFEDCRTVIDEFSKQIANPFFEKEIERSQGILKRGLPIYASALSPLPRDFTVRAGELAAARLANMQKKNSDFAKAFEDRARASLEGRPAEERMYRLWEFPATKTSQKILNELFASAAAPKTFAERKRLWQLADVARVSNLTIPNPFRASVLAMNRTVPEPSLSHPREPRSEDITDSEATDWLVLERRGDRSASPNLAFMGGRVKKRLLYKFGLKCKDLENGKDRWNIRDIRLKGKGEEPGFFEAFVHEDLVVVHGLYDVIAFRLKNGEKPYHYRVPFNFEIKHVVQSGDLLVLAGDTETIALHIPSGEVAWQMKERGDVYAAPYFAGDRLISVRKLPFNVTVRFRGTGILIGRLSLPDLCRNDTHPILRDGPRALPVAHHGHLLALTDNRYYILLDVRGLQVIWKRPIDARGVAREPALRFLLSSNHLFVTKRDFDEKAIYALSVETGEVLWTSSTTHKGSAEESTEREPDAGPRLAPLHSMFVAGDTVCGIERHAATGFYFVGREAATGKLRYRTEVLGYSQKPDVRMAPRAYGKHAVVTVRDRQDFEVRAFDLRTGQPVMKLKKKGTGDFGIHGRVSHTVQAGKMLFLSKYDLSH